MKHHKSLLMLVFVVMIIVHSSSQLLDCSGLVNSLLSIVNLDVLIDSPCTITNKVIQMANGNKIKMKPAGKLIITGSGRIANGVRIEPLNTGEQWLGVEVGTLNVASVNLEGLAITGGGISVTGTTSVVLKNSQLLNTDIALQSSGNAHISVQGCTINGNRLLTYNPVDYVTSREISFIGNTMEFVNANSLSIQKLLNSVVSFERNTIKGRFESVMTDLKDTHTTISNNTIVANSINSLFIVELQSSVPGASSLTLSGNTISGTSSGGLVFKVLSSNEATVSIVDNNLSDLTVSAIMQLNLADGQTQISENTITNATVSSPVAILLSSTSSIQFMDNTIGVVTGSDYIVSSPSNLYFEGNVVVDVQSALLQSSKLQTFFSNTVDKLVSNNGIMEVGSDGTLLLKGNEISSVNCNSSIGFMFTSTNLQIVGNKFTDIVAGDLFHVDATELLSKENHFAQIQVSGNLFNVDAKLTAENETYEDILGENNSNFLNGLSLESLTVTNCKLQNVTGFKELISSKSQLTKLQNSIIEAPMWLVVSSGELFVTGNTITNAIGLKSDGTLPAQILGNTFYSENKFQLFSENNVNVMLNTFQQPFEVLTLAGLTFKENNITGIIGQSVSALALDTRDATTSVIRSNTFTDVSLSAALIKLNITAGAQIDVLENTIAGCSFDKSFDIQGLSGLVNMNRNVFEDIAPPLASFFDWDADVDVDASYNYWGFTDESLFGSLVSKHKFSPYFVSPAVNELTKFRYIPDTIQSLVNLQSGFICNGIASDVVSVCNGRGPCTSDNKCNCLPGFGGIACEFVTCINDAVVDLSAACSNHGSCIGSVCNCTSDYAGLLCAIPLFSCENDCNNHGTCIGPNICVCSSEYEGTYCENLIPVAESSSHIVAESTTEHSCLCGETQECVNGNCECIDGFTGQNCDTLSAELQLKEIDKNCTHAKYQVLFVKTDYSTIPIDESMQLQWLSPDNQNLASYLSSQSGTIISVPTLYFPINRLVRIKAMISYFSQAKWEYMNVYNSIPPQGLTITGPRNEVPRSDQVLSSSTASLVECALSVEYVWKLMESETQFVGQTVTVHKENLPANSGEVTIELYTRYHFPTYTALVISNSISFTVKSNNPVLVIEGSQSRTVLLGNLVTIDASKSFDPEGTLQSEWTLEVECITGCPIVFDAEVTNLVATFNASLAGTITYAVKLSSGTRVDRKLLVVSVIESDNAPLISIQSSDRSSFVNRFRKLTLTGLIDEKQLLRVNKTVEWQWSVGGIRNIFATKENLKRVTIAPGTLASNKNYVITLRANFRGSTEFSSTSIIIRTSSPPANGRVSVTPTSGTALATNFEFTAEEWTSDNEEPLTYIYQYIDEDNNQLKEIVTTTQPTISLNLPPGFSKNRLSVIVRIRNSFGEESIRQIPLIVAPLTNPNLIRSRLNAFTGDSDLQSALGKLTVITSSLSAVTEETSEIKNQALDILSSLILDRVSDIDEQIVSSAFGTLEIFSRDTNNQTSKQTILEVSKQLLQVGFSVSDGNTMNQTISTLSRVFDNTSPDLSLQSLDAVTEFARMILSQSVPSEEPTYIESEAFSMTLFKALASSSQNTTIEFEESIVLLEESSLLDSLGESDIAIRGITFNNGNPYEWSLSSANISSTVLEFTVLDSNGNKIELDAISFTLSQREYIENNTKPVCKFWNEDLEIWDTYGCYVKEYTSFSVTCFCNHTTSFASFIQYDDTTFTAAFTQEHRVTYIVSIVISGLYLTICVMLFGYLFVSYTNQPIYSRFLTPFIGLTAIALECLLQGIVRNSLLIMTTRPDKALNALSNVIVVIVNTLNLLALFVFAWQLARYTLMRHTYRIMKTSEKGTLFVFRLLTSKVLYLIGAALFTIICFLYYLAVVLGTSKAINSSISATLATTLPAATYMSNSLLIAIAIATLFAIDLVYYCLTVTIDVRGLKTKSDRNGGDYKPHETIFEAIRDFLGKSDPLKFRTDGIFMLLALTSMCVAYGLGFDVTFTLPNAPKAKVIVQVAFDLLFIGLKIAAYAGNCTVFTVLFKHYKDKYEERFGQDTSVEQLSGNIEPILKDPTGYNLFEAFCMQEMSLENLLLWSELIVIQPTFNTMTSDMRSTILKELKEKYVQSGQYEVNLDGKTRKYMEEVVSKGSSATIEECQQTLYKLYRGVMLNISDTFSRFCRSADYIQYDKSKRLHKELVELSRHESTMHLVE